jgi:hypothetical protein
LRLGTHIQKNVKTAMGKNRDVNGFAAGGLLKNHPLSKTQKQISISPCGKTVHIAVYPIAVFTGFVGNRAPRFPKKKREKGKRCLSRQRTFRNPILHCCSRTPELIQPALLTIEEQSVPPTPSVTGILAIQTSRD